MRFLVSGQGILASACQDRTGIVAWRVGRDGDGHFITPRGPHWALNAGFFGKS
ncbi:hypothetical protein [Bradyrhizobium sp. SYSU BS000235]|uniref:hypothetical protein n=1 Tax=Bradyrhizobium sp. SYSU BS000235 TaxID=3411332 RepID=UPI003C72AF24